MHRSWLKKTDANEFLVLQVSLVLDVGDVQNSWMSGLVRLEKREEDKPPPAFTTFSSIRSILYNLTCAAPAVLLLQKFPAQGQ